MDLRDFGFNFHSWWKDFLVICNKKKRFRSLFLFLFEKKRLEGLFSKKINPYLLPKFNGALQFVLVTGVWKGSFQDSFQCKECHVNITGNYEQKKRKKKHYW